MRIHFKKNSVIVSKNMNVYSVFNIKSVSTINLYLVESQFLILKIFESLFIFLFTNLFLAFIFCFVVFVLI